MAQTYPYYVATYMDAGILKKILNGKKFKTYNECVIAAKNRYVQLSKIWGGKNLFFENQIAILEYTETYNGRIVTLFTNGNEVNISDPVIFD